MSNGLDVQQSSPSQTALSESALNEKALCDYVCNVADGCRHGCQFCYVRSMAATWGDPGDKYADAGVDDPQGDWGDYVLYRDDVVENAAKDCQRLADSWRTTEKGQGIVGISFATDCYMDPRAAELTRNVVNVLVGHDRPARILTRNPKLLVDLHEEFYEFLPEDAVTIGTSLPTLNAEEAAAIEPGAPSVEQRLEPLAELENTPTFVSMSPTYPTMGYDDIQETLATIGDVVDLEVVFHEPINPRAGSVEECCQAARAAGEDHLANALEIVAEDTESWRYYALQQLRDAQLAAEDLGVPIHLWPDEQLATHAPTEAQREWCQAWRDRASPEEIGDGEACTDPYPEIPQISPPQQRLDEAGFQ